jgi:hypothetical protein
VFFFQNKKAGQTEKTTEKNHKLAKRQIPFLPDGTFMDYAAYDYYDWVCSNGFCQICDVLSGVCCNPATQANCFLPDSCANNPCLSGGTCVNTLTVAGNRDFTCICQRGLTGKYCQLIDEFTPPLVAPIPLAAAPYPAPAQSFAPAPAQSFAQGPAQSFAQGPGQSFAQGPASSQFGGLGQQPQLGNPLAAPLPAGPFGGLSPIRAVG